MQQILEDIKIFIRILLLTDSQFSQGRIVFVRKNSPVSEGKFQVKLIFKQKEVLHGKWQKCIDSYSNRMEIAEHSRTHFKQIIDIIFSSKAHLFRELNIFKEEVLISSKSLHHFKRLISNQGGISPLSQDFQRCLPLNKMMFFSRFSSNSCAYVC